MKTVDQNGRPVASVPFRVKARTAQIQAPVGHEWAGKWIWEIQVVSEIKGHEGVMKVIQSHEIQNPEVFDNQSAARVGSEPHVQKVLKLISDAAGSELAGVFDMKDGGKFKTKLESLQ